MKTPPSRRLRGFTLVELLVVIAIIAVLAAAGFAAGNAAIQKARRLTALSTATSIQDAVNAFFNEYGAMPTDQISEGDADAPPLNTKTDTKFLQVLLGMEDPKDPNLMNTRGIRFLNVAEGKKKGATGGTNGLVFSDDGKTVRGLFDPWGGPYFVLLDTGFDEQISAKTAAEKSSKVLNRKVAVWTNGADNTTGKPGGGKATDDVKTW